MFLSVALEGHILLAENAQLNTHQMPVTVVAQHPTLMAAALQKALTVRR